MRSQIFHFPRFTFHFKMITFAPRIIKPIKNMKCPKCSHENDENALYCNKCGIKFDKKQDWNSILIMAYCFSIIFLAITNACIGYLFDWIGCTWQTKHFVYLFLNIIAALLTFVLPFGIRNTWMKVVSFILIAIAATINISRNIYAIIETYNTGF